MKLLIKHKKTVVTVFLITVIICMAASTLVKVDYNIMDYLPDESPSTIALDVMDEQFDKGAPNVRVMLKDVSISDVLEYKDKFKAIDGVEDVTWLDDAANIYQPIEYLPAKTVEEYYKDGNALLTVTVDEDKEEAAIDEMKNITGKKGAFCGTAVDSVTAITLTTAEINKIMVIVVILIFIILTLTTNSFFEPVLFLLIIGAAIMINRGTNLLFGTISFVTNAAGSILQLAVSIDYSIFLLHTFTKMREQYDDVDKAMAEAVKKAFSSIMSSGLTTVIGFAALILMRFKIGPDMGYVMAKAIVISLVCVLVLMPSLTLVCYKLIDKTQHKMIMPQFGKFSDLVFKYKNIMLITFIVLIVPCYLGQGANTFTYGQAGIYGEGTELGNDTALIESTFGKSNLMVLMVPCGSPSKEKALNDDLMAQEKVTSVISYAETVGVSIPTEFIPDGTLSQLMSDKYSRMVITVDTDSEGSEAFGLVETVRDIAKKHFGNDYLLAGTSVNSYDMKDVVTSDTTKVNFVSILAIGIVLLFNFKSLSIPLILLAVIELSIFINLTIPYFRDETLFYIGYLIISSIQLGATVDYAILFTEHYIENRASHTSAQSVKRTITETSLSILTSASILTVCGLLLGVGSSNGIISQLGILVGRGAVLSGILVLFVLPCLLVTFDKVIYKTSYKMNFYQEGEGKHDKKA